MLHSPDIEIAAFPVLYPRTRFGDTDIKDNDLLAPNAEASIVTSHLHKILSSCIGYTIQPKLTFLLYDIAMVPPFL